ncbi:MAG TPA: 50S ribosomal protein L9 [Chloroflexi bacterium]|nr:50S ribosomal protein L9 [Chloroflexota bacterium]
MKVLLLQDVYKLGRAGDVKKVANGYGRNYLIPQGLAVLATPGALKQAERIRARAEEQRAILNKEMGAVAEKLADVVLTFPMRASQTGKLYGSVTTQMLADAISEKTGVEISRRQIDTQPLRMLGEYEVNVRLTVDLIPSIKVIVYREGEAIPTLEDEEAEESAPIDEETVVEAAEEATSEAGEEIPAEEPEAAAPAEEEAEAE